MQSIPQRFGNDNSAGLIDNQSGIHNGATLWVEPAINAILTHVVKNGQVWAANRGREPAFLPAQHAESAPREIPSLCYASSPGAAANNWTIYNPNDIAKSVVPCRPDVMHSWTPQSFRWNIRRTPVP